MSQSVFRIKRGDTRPPIKWQCLNDMGQPQNLTGATVRFKMGKPVKVNTPAVISDAALGVVSYQWVVADTNAAGVYPGEFEVTYADGGIESFPDDGYIRVEVQEDI